MPNNVPNNFMSYSVTVWVDFETMNTPKSLTNKDYVGVFRSVLSEVKCIIHLDGVQGVASSNPAIPTNDINPYASAYGFFIVGPAFYIGGGLAAHVCQKSRATQQ